MGLTYLRKCGLRAAVIPVFKSWSYPLQVMSTTYISGLGPYYHQPVIHCTVGISIRYRDIEYGVNNTGSHRYREL